MILVGLLLGPLCLPVTAKVEVPQGRATLVVKRVVVVWERQLNCVWGRELCPRALASSKGDSIQ